MQRKIFGVSREMRKVSEVPRRTSRDLQGSGDGTKSERGVIRNRQKDKETDEGKRMTAEEFANKVFQLVSGTAILYWDKAQRIEINIVADAHELERFDIKTSGNIY